MQKRTDCNIYGKYFTEGGALADPKMVWPIEIALNQVVTRFSALFKLPHLQCKGIDFSYYET